MKRSLFMLVCLLILLASCASAETRSYTYGGSGTDTLYDAAAGTDGRIILTGETDSSDGTLSSRTKMGHSAWALCIDAQGQVLWNFCTRLGSTDTMRYPILHDDGSATMLLETSHDGLYEAEWIHLDAQGNLLERRTLVSKGVPYAIRAWGVLEGQGYVVKVFDKKQGTQQCYLYGFDGSYIGEVPETDTPYFPEARLADGCLISIANENDAPWDATVTLSSTYKVLRVAPKDGAAALLYSQPDESSVPIGQCLPGTHVTLLKKADGAEGWLYVTIEGYNGYMLAEVFESIE